MLILGVCFFVIAASAAMAASWLPWAGLQLIFLLSLTLLAVCLLTHIWRQLNGKCLR